MISTLNKRGTVFGLAMGNTPGPLRTLPVFGTVAVVAVAVVYRRTLSELGTRSGARQLHKGDDT